jgi:hypothetical protein
LGTTGVLVKVRGTVTAVTGDGYFYVEDGSMLDDRCGNVGIRVYGTPPADPVGKRVSVTGISAIEMLGTDPIPVIRTRRAGDVAEL